MLVLHIPHASTHIPPEIRDQFLLSDAELEAEIQAMTDHRTDELFAGHGGVVVAAEVSRLVVDVERFLPDPMEAVGMGAVYTRTSHQEPLRRQLTLGERQSLLDRFYHPQHARLTEAVQPGSLIIDCHSFPGKALPYERDQSPDRPDFCIGTDDYHTPPELAAVAVDFLESRGYSVWFNRPFAGTMVPARYYRQDASVRSIMVEVNRRLYLDDAEGFARTRAAVGELVGAHRVFDVKLGRSEPSLRRYLQGLEGRSNVQVVVMDLSETYRSIARRYFPNATIVADRFHVVRLINQHFLKVWQQYHPEGRKNRGLLSLMRRHQWRLSDEQQVNLMSYLSDFPVLQALYVAKQKLIRFVLLKTLTARRAKAKLPRYLELLEQLRNYRLRVLVHCGWDGIINRVR